MKSQTLAEEQSKDADLSLIRNYPQSGSLPSDHQEACSIVTSAQLFVLSDNILYYINPHHKSLLRAVVPKHLRKRVMEQNHGGPYRGHISGDRLFKTLSRKWWWKGMYKDCVEYSKNCPDCSFVLGEGSLVGPHYNRSQYPVLSKFLE